MRSSFCSGIDQKVLPAPCSLWMRVQRPKSLGFLEGIAQMSVTQCEAARTPACDGRSPARSWLRALELTAPIARNRERLFSSVIEEWAETSGDAPALLSGRECMTYRALYQRSNQCTRWA